MIAKDLTRYEDVQRLCKELGCTVFVKGAYFIVERNSGEVYGSFEFMKDIHNFLLGVVWGRAEGKLAAFKFKKVTTP